MSSNNDTINEHKPISNTTLNRLTVVPFFHQNQRRGSYPLTHLFGRKYEDIICLLYIYLCSINTTTTATVAIVVVDGETEEG